jgi:hypothetical protein
MSNPFDSKNLVPNWNKASEILKGDVPGHPFHGNQYSESHAGRAMALAHDATEVRNREKENGVTSRAHLALAVRHIDLGNELNEAVRQGKEEAMNNGTTDNPIVRSALRGAELAAQAHFAAAKAHDGIANGKIPYSYGAKVAQLNEAEALSHVAAMASNNTMQLGERATSSS